MNNNKMERLNGEIRDREKVFRGLKKMDTPILEGLKAYYNYTKKHGALKGKTPSESALIEVDGKISGKPSFKTLAFTGKITNKFFIVFRSR